MRAMLLLHALCVNAYQSYSLCLSGHGARGQRLFDEARFPAVGDVVMEITTIGDRDRDLERFGVLEEVGAEDGEQVYHVRLLDGRLLRWHDCQFIKVPCSLDAFLGVEEPG